MTMPSSHRFRNSSHVGLRLSTLPLGHGGSPQYWIFTSERQRNIWLFWNLKAREGLEPAIFDFPSWQLLTTAPGPEMQGPRPVVVMMDMYLTRQTRCARPVLRECWVSVVFGPALNQYWIVVSCLLSSGDYNAVCIYVLIVIIKTGDPCSSDR